MSFDRPLLLLTLLLVPLAIAGYRWSERRRMRYAVAYTNLDVLARVATPSRWRRLLPPILFLLALTALCLGLARPHRTTLVPEDKATVILVIDVSRSMESRDVKPSRLEAAKAAVRLFLTKVPTRLRVGMIAFAGDPQVATPPTRDRAVLRQALEGIAYFPSYGGTAIGDAIAAAVELGRQSVEGEGGSLAAATEPRTKGLVSILFLSDGAQTRGTLQPLEGADLARAAAIPVFTVALGTPNGTLQFGPGGPPGQPPPGSGVPPGFGNSFGGRRRVPPDPVTMKAIATRTNGEFVAARSAKALRAAYSKLGSELGRRKGRTEITYLFLAAAAALLLAAGILSALWSPRLP